MKDFLFTTKDIADKAVPKEPITMELPVSLVTKTKNGTEPTVSKSAMEDNNGMSTPTNVNV